MTRPGSVETALRMMLAVVCDFAVACATLALVIYIRRTLPVPFTRSLLPPDHLFLDTPMVLLFGTAFVVGLGLSGFYRLRITPRARPILMVALLIQVALVTIGATLLERPLPRTIVLAVPLLEAIAFPIWRSLQQRMWPARRRDTVLVGDPPDISAAIAVLATAGDPRIRVIGYAGGGPADVPVPWLGPLDQPDVRRAVRDIEEAINVSSDATAHGRLELLRIRGPRGYLLLASQADALLISSVLGWMGDEPLIEVAIGCGYGVRAIVKRAIDIGVGLVLMSLALPMMMCIGIALWLDDRGPVLLRQMRVGLGGVPFRMWKFRSMRSQSPTDNDQTDDARITRVGRFLRRYRLDELPQLLNVIIGDMSLVGPRPERPEITERILRDLPDFDLRCLVRPGIAGLAQISAEYDSRPAVKLRYDITYMCSWSLWLDARLLFAGVAAALSGSGV